MQPLVSIVVPIYNTEEFLSQCVESLLAQSMTNLEIILVNDGSPDGSAAIVDQYAQQDPRIKTVHQSNRGLPGARNAGMAVATGQYLGFVDSDDWVEEHMFAKLLATIEEFDSDVVMCDYTKVSGNRHTHRCSNLRGGHFDRAQIEDEILPSSIMDKGLEGPAILAVWRCLYRRSFLAKRSIKFDEAAKYSEDYLFSLEVMINANSFTYLKDHHLYMYRSNPESLSQTLKSDSWTKYTYLNEAMEQAVERTSGGNLPANLAHQLNLHMLYVALFTINLMNASDLTIYEQHRQLKAIVHTERLRSALKSVSSSNYPVVTRTRIVLLRLGTPTGLIFIDRAAKILRRLK